MSVNKDTCQNPNNVVTVKFNLTVTVILCLAIVALSVANFGLGDSVHDAIVFFLLLIGGACQISLAYYSLKNLQLATQAQTQSLSRLREQEAKLEKQRKADKAAMFAARWNDPAMVESRKVVRKITTINDVNAVLAWLKSSDDIEAEHKEGCARHALNFLEELSAAVNEGYCDEEYVCRLFKGIVINIWSAMSAWVNEERIRKHRQTIFVETENLYNRWKVSVG